MTTDAPTSTTSAQDLPLLPFQLESGLRVAAMILAAVTLAVASHVAFEVRPGVFNPDFLMQGIQPLIIVPISLLAAVLMAGYRRVIPFAIDDERFEGLYLRGIAVGVLLMVAVVETATHWIGIPFLGNVAPVNQVRLFVAAVVALGWGASGGGNPFRRIWRFLKERPPFVRREMAFVLYLTLIGLAVRLYQLESALHLFVDELNFANILPRFVIEYEQEPNIFANMVQGWFPGTFPYLQHLTVAQFGHSLASLRYVSVVFGTLTIPGTYLLARSLFDRPTALVAGVLMVTFPVHVQFSRIGINNIADPFFGVWAMAFLAQGMRSNRRVDFVLGGLMLGLTQYWYEVGRIIYPTAILLWAVLGVITGYSRKRLKGLLLAAFVAAVAAAPVYATIYDLETQLLPRAHVTSDEKGSFSALDTLQDTEAHHTQLSVALRVYFNAYEFGNIYFGGTQPMLMIFLVPFFFIGAGYVLLYPGRPAFMLGLLVLLTSFSTSLVDSPGIFARYVVTFPALVIITAVGMRVTVGLLMALPFLQKRRFALAGSLFILATGMAVMQALFFFGPHLDALNEQMRLHRQIDTTDAVFRAARFGEDAQIHIITADFDETAYLNNAMAYLLDNPGNDNVHMYQLDDFGPDTFAEFDPSQKHIFYTPIHALYARALIKWRFIAGDERVSPYNVPLYVQSLEIETFALVQGPSRPLPTPEIPYGQCFEQFVFPDNDCNS